MRVLIVSPYRTVAPHFENELEIAQRHIDQGDQVTMLACLGDLSGCDFNPGGDKDVCSECKLRRQHGLLQLTKRIKTLGFSSRRSSKSEAIGEHLPEAAFANLQSLKQTCVDDFDVGYATISSTVSQVRDPEVDIAANREMIEMFSGNALRVYRTLIDRFAVEKPDRVYVFNGRFASMRAVLRACQKTNVECLIHERGCDTRHYQLFRNHLPHNIAYVESRMRNHWQRANNDPNRDAQARDWFLDRVNGVEKNWHSFVKDQQRGALPAGWDPERHNIVLFTSSEDEFVAIGSSWSNRLYPDQTAAIESIADRLIGLRPDASIIVRMHPNQRAVRNAARFRLQGIQRPNVHVIPPGAKIDTYALLQAADTVATFGSSIGVEAVFWEKPSVLLGPCFYQNLKGPFRATSHDQAVGLLADNLQPAAEHEALIYGYWQNTHGIPFRYFEPGEDLFTGTFRGTRIYPKPPKTAARSLARKWRSIRKRIPLPKRPDAA